MRRKRILRRKNALQPVFEVKSLYGATSGKTFQFSWEQYSQLKAFLNKLQKLPGEQWPPPEQWPYFEGLPPFELAIYETPGQSLQYMVIKFIYRSVQIPLNLFDYKTGRRFKIGKYAKDFQPLLPVF